jgi:hypothetical protein
MSSSNILALPREIRDIIYTNLTHDININWGYRTSSFPIGGHIAVRIKLRNAPIPAVLLTCTQIYHEYRENKRFKRPSVAVSVGTDCTWHLLECERTNQVQVSRVLENIQQLDILVDSAKEECGQSLGLLVDELSRAIALLAPKLETIRVIAQPLGTYDSLRKDPVDSETIFFPPILAGDFFSPDHTQETVLAYFRATTLPRKTIIVGDQFSTR